MSANQEEKIDASKAAVEKAIRRQRSPKMMGEEAKRRAVARERIREDRRGWSIYGGCWCISSGAKGQRAPLHYSIVKKGLRVFFCVKS